MYAESNSVEKVKRLLSALIDTENPVDLSRKNGVGKEIQPIRPDSSEGNRLIKQCGFEYNLYRIDYGNTPFRIIFGLSNVDRLAYIFGIDTTHQTFSGKHRN